MLRCWGVGAEAEFVEGSHMRVLPVVMEIWPILSVMVMIVVVFVMRRSTFLVSEHMRWGFWCPSYIFYVFPHATESLKQPLQWVVGDQFRICIVHFAMMVQSQNWGGGGGRGAMKRRRQLAQFMYPK
eukprot:scaffold163983_cov23-Cyclotella_meneghiniana.AAC.1